MKAIAIIPARIGSIRLPRKILREIAGQSMLQRVYQAAKNSKLLQDVIVATDSEEIMAMCERHGWRAQITSGQHKSGTDRVHEVAQKLEADVFVNVQGDEPLARAEHIDALLKPMADAHVMVSTVMTPCPKHDVANPNAVKVVTDSNGRALYFSRATIPFDRDNRKEHPYMKHLGFYAYRRSALDRFCNLPESALEKSERLEQLRFLENGIDIYVQETQYDTIGVDTEEDLRRVESILLKK
ncbi:MAG TPA: 3-deoxy-manno-octulosonate cytidylyltransferase [Terriglobales bacterium]|nr:3-deoxy-manno-octulosonate cytidylyltransferase [Terriglobales bacterium]